MPKRQQLKCALCGRTGSSGFTTDQEGRTACKATKACLKRRTPKRPKANVRKRADEAAERANLVLRLKREGYRQDAIAATVGITPGRVSQIISEHYAKLAEESKAEAAHLRQIELERIDHLYQQLAPFAVRTPLFDPESGLPLTYRPDSEGNVYAAEGPPSLAAIDALRRLSESRRKLLGLDAPAEVKHSGTVEHQHGPLEPDKAARVFQVLAEVGAFGQYKPSKVKASAN